MRSRSTSPDASTSAKMITRQVDGNPSYTEDLTGSVAPRSYRSASRRPPAARTVADGQVIDALRALQGAGPGGGPAPETLYGRRKMTAWLERNGFPGLSKPRCGPADAPRRPAGLGPRPQGSHHDPGHRRPPRWGSAQSAVPHRRAEPRLGHRLHLCADVVRVCLRRVRDRPLLPRRRRRVGLDGEGRRDRRVLPENGALAPRPHQPPYFSWTYPPQLARLFHPGGFVTACN
jgi:hypothetical protein